MNSRLETLRAAMRERELEALLVSNATNRRYISGFSGTAGALLVTADAALLLTDFRYVGRARYEAPAFKLDQIGGGRLLTTAVVEAAAELGIEKLAFEAQHISVAQFHKFTAAIDEAEMTPKLELLPVEGVVETLREVKDADELATLRKAIAITDEAISEVVPCLTPQHSEWQAAWMLEVAMRERGAEAVSFPIIVAAGRKAAQPHAEPGDALLGSGQPIIIDMGARYQGYHADLTRTIVLGEPDERFHQIYQTVRDAQQYAIAHLRPGMSSAEADALARNRIDAAGYGEAFGHSLGHGVGLQIHEGPSLSQSGEQTLQVNNVFSVEPGIYLEEWGGVRIEDLVLLTADGCEVLSRAPALQQY